MSAQTANPQTPAATTYLVTNDDQPFPFGNSLSVYQATTTNGAPSLTYVNTIFTGGFGSYGGFFSTNRINSVPDVNAHCFFVSNSADNSISVVSLDSQDVINVVKGSDTDDGNPDGIGLVVNKNYLYASYTTSKTIGVFATSEGCGLTFLQDVPAEGLSGGAIAGMAVNANTLAVAYGDGSFESFNVSNGIPVSNNDRQNSTAHSGILGSAGSDVSNLPSGVDLTSDGKFAIFGDVSNSAYVEVSKILNGKLQRTTPFKAADRVDAANIRLSPDQKLIYMVNNESGSVTAAFFNAATGAVTAGCVSPALQGFNTRPWFGGIVTRDTTGSGGVLYVAEFGRFIEEHTPASAIGILTVTVNGNTCTLTESPNSPVILDFPGTLSIEAFPPRPF
jgi:6-phosphogluconolactonase (cycloisomerase 2 family)